MLRLVPFHLRPCIYRDVREPVVMRRIEYVICVRVFMGLWLVANKGIRGYNVVIDIPLCVDHKCKDNIITMAIRSNYVVIIVPLYGSTIGGWEKSRRPQPGIQAQRPCTRTAHTTRQINGARFVWWLAETLNSWPRGRRVVSSLANAPVYFCDTSTEISIFSQKV